MVWRVNILKSRWGVRVYRIIWRKQMGYKLAFDEYTVYQGFLQLWVCILMWWYTWDVQVFISVCILCNFLCNLKPYIRAAKSIVHKVHEVHVFKRHARATHVHVILKVVKIDRIPPLLLPVPQTEFFPSNPYPFNHLPRGPPRPHPISPRNMCA